jgi:hypothetical protein
MAAPKTGLGSFVSITDQAGVWGALGLNESWAHFHDINSCSINESPANAVTRAELGSVGGLPLSTHRDMIEAGGQIVQEAKFGGQGLIWESLLGQSSSSGGGPYVHLYEPAADRSLPIRSILLGRGNESEDTFESAMCASGVWRGQAGGPSTLTTEWVVRKSKDGSRAAFGTTTPSFTPRDRINFFQSDSNFIAWNGGNYDVVSWELSVVNTGVATRRWRSGSRYAQQPVITGHRLATLRVVVELEDQTLRDAARARTIADLLWKLEGDGNNYFELDANNAEIVEPTNDAIGGSGVIQQTLMWKFHADRSGNPGIQVRIQNDQTTATEA